MIGVKRIDFASGDLASQGDLDDLAISGDQIELLHIERMSGDTVWGRIDLKDGSAVVLWFHVQKRTLVMTAEDDGPFDLAPPAPKEEGRG